MTTHLIILAILFLCFSIYIWIASKNKSDQLDGFFLGGRNVHGSLFEHTTWGTSFALNNGIYWGIYFGYTAGLSAIWINASWVLGFFGLSLLVPRLIKPTGRFTLHGYLGNVYGGKTRIIASIASSTAMLLNLGSEIVFAAILLSLALGSNNIEIAFVLIFALFAASYCRIGGYRANAAIDKFQNIITICSLMVLLMLFAGHGNEFTNSMLVAAGLGLLLLVVFIVDSARSTSTSNWRQNTLLLISLFCFIWALGQSETLHNQFAFGSLVNSFVHPNNLATDYIVSLMAFQFLYQFVDTVNWQNISAHNISESNSIKSHEISSALRKAGFKILIAPIAIGSFIGYTLKALAPNLQSAESSFIYDAINLALPTDIHIASAIAIGLLLFSLIGAGLSGVDSWLMAASQTYSWDILDYKIFKKNDFQIKKFDANEQNLITQKAKSLLYVYALIGAMLYYSFYKMSDGKIVILFFVIFSSSLSLFPSLMYALLYSGEKYQRNLSITAFASIALGYISPLLLVIYSFFFESLNIYGFHLARDDMYTYGPFLAIGVSTLIFAIGIALIGFVPNNKDAASTQ